MIIFSFFFSIDNPFIISIVTENTAEQSNVCGMPLIRILRADRFWLPLLYVMMTVRP